MATKEEMADIFGSDSEDEANPEGSILTSNFIHFASNSSLSAVPQQKKVDIDALFESDDDEDEVIASSDQINQSNNMPSF